jgi:replication factor C subunit 3/5
MSSMEVDSDDSPPSSPEIPQKRRRVVVAPTTSSSSSSSSSSAPPATNTPSKSMVEAFEIGPYDAVGGQARAEALASAAHEQLPWVEKYRPSDLSEVISHGSIIQTIDSLMSRGKLPHLLFYGPPGTGKTSTILACAQKLHGAQWRSMVLELNASDDRGIDTVRNQIKSFASSRQLFNSGFKLIILDEADAMTKDAQFALRRVMEQNTKNTRFCLICNYINKIIPALQSRCTRFRFGPLEREQIQGRLDVVIRTEGVRTDADAVKAIIKLSGGDMRKCLNVLQSCHMAYPEVTADNVYLCTGNPRPRDVQQILAWLLNHPFVEAFRNIADMQTANGISLVDVVECLHDLVLKVQFPPRVLAYVLDKLSDVEYRLASGVSERLQLGSLVGLFQVAKEMTAAEQRKQ